MANVGVKLFNSSGSLIASTTTNASGNYLFSGLAAGQYYLQFTAPSGYVFTAPYQGDDTIDSHADPATGDTEQFDLIAGENDSFINAGLIPNSAQPTTSTTLAADANPSDYDDSVTFTATVNQTDSTPLGGTVTFMDGNDVLGTVELDTTANGYQATFATSSLSQGSHNISAIYNGDGFHQGSSASMTQTVQQELSFTSVTSSNNPALLGQPVTFTASVNAPVDTPTGTVTFYDGSTELGTGTLDANGNATFTTSSLTLGSHNITATYSGDSNLSGSSGSLTQVISQENSSSITLSSSANPSTPGQSVTFTAPVTGNNGTPTGTATFMNGNIPLGIVTLDGTGTATFTTSALSLGNQIITVIYNGNATYASSSASLTQPVYQAGSSTSVTVSPNPAQLGQPVTIIANISPSGSGTPTGDVTFYDGTTSLGSASITQVNGQDEASITTSSLPSGSNEVTAVYDGDETFESNSGSTTETVGQSSGVSVLMHVAVPFGTPQPGQSVTFSVSLSGFDGTPTGTVTFLDGTTVLGTSPVDASGNASLTTAGLGLGDHDIVIVYSGDSTYAGKTDSLTQRIDLEQTQTSMNSSASSSPLGQPVTFTATIAPQGSSSLTPTGTVSFYDGTTLLGSGTLTLVNGKWQAAFTTAAMGLGTHNIIAIYSGDGSFAESESSLTQTITS